ncbi:peptidoglycan bridge formation glycyltransferase FemA/FemB family protein [uncultured Mobiluncus sp.]|uniref:peptidoglycan bridge formation glycyltransferase FemA/FemB family protein n=1 Tax=uncultured Mobiluncus sp. TaxID=293425 RepID=UPI00260A203E|nr:peptidoglycan bridge formation glycyltransferase FemA/FemB family protein [uncultured Mobiluncus sp.]
MSASEQFVFDNHVDPAEYDAFVTAQPNCNLLQSADWAKVKNTWGHRLTALRDTSGRILVAGLVLIRPLKLGYTMWYLPHGPIMDYGQPEPGAPDLLQVYLRELRRSAKRAKAAFIKVDPPVALQAKPLEEMSDDPSARNPGALQVLARFEDQGFRHQGFPKVMHETLQPRYTTATMCPPEGKTLLEVVPKRTRRFVKDAESRFVQVRQVGPEALPDFLDVISHTEQDKGIHLRSGEYFESLMRIYGQRASLWMAYLDLDEAADNYRAKISKAEESLKSLADNATQKRREYTQQIASSRKNLEFVTERSHVDKSPVPLAGCLSVLYGTGFEMLYAGMNRHYSKITAQDLIYIKSMSDAFERGARYCSIGGVSGTLDDGLMKFKSHFSPLVIEKLGEFDLPLRPLIYRAVRFYLRHR